jgi:hypothetical protein
VGNLIKVNSDLGLGLLFAKVAEEMLEQNILQKFNTNAKHHISVEQFQYHNVLVVFRIIQ